MYKTWFLAKFFDTALKKKIGVVKYSIVHTFINIVPYSWISLWPANLIAGAFVAISPSTRVRHSRRCPAIHTRNFSKLNSMESASGSWREKSVPYFKTTQQWTTTLPLAADQFFSIGFSNLQLLRCQLIFFEEILKLTWRHALKYNLSVENMFKRINTNFKFDCDFHFPRMPPLVSFL